MDLDSIAPELRSAYQLAVDLARRAGAVQREHYETELDVRTKSASIDLVTQVDHECEALIVSGIEAVRPGDAILAEEGGGENHSRSDWRWIIDPLDGTTNYAHGFPRFCVSIGVEHEGERRIGVVYDPLLDELFHCVHAAGAWLGHRRLRVSTQTDLGQALVATGFAYDVHDSTQDNLARFARVLKAARGLRRDGSAALDLCYVASGRLEAYWELKLHAWDVAAGILMVEEAGGRVTSTDGGPAPRSGAEVVASNGHVHDAILSHTRG
ncbi:MAG: inositol monophosphatase [Deltaproteobacteria bacterium]|jgi:myo-inositol-1(or 4)-monophosphatase|nr:inositol monophosphatase [Deltaproteobacteria bacterium]